MKFLAFVCFLLSFIGLGQVQAQYTPWHPVLIDDVVNGLLSTHFTCAYIDPLSGYAHVKFGGGRQAYSWTGMTPKSLLFADGTSTGTMTGGVQYTRAYNQPGTHWVLLRDLSTSNIVDYLQVEIVTHGVYNGDCYALMATDSNFNTGVDGGPLPPTNWDTLSLPPAYTPSSN